MKTEPAPVDARPAAEPRQDEEKELSRVDAIPSDPSLGSTAPRNELIRQLRQERDAQFAHNTELVDRLDELQRDNDMCTTYLARIEGIVNGSASTGFINWNLHDRIAALVGQVKSVDAVDPVGAERVETSTRDNRSSSSVSDRVRAEQAEARLAAVLAVVERWTEKSLANFPEYLAEVRALIAAAKQDHP